MSLMDRARRRSSPMHKFMPCARARSQTELFRDAEVVRTRDPVILKVRSLAHRRHCASAPRWPRIKQWAAY